MKKLIEKIWNWVAICFGVVFGIAFFGWIAGALVVLLLGALLPKFPVDAVMSPANNIADWRSLVTIAIGCVAIACFLAIKSLFSRPLEKLIEKSFARWDAVIGRASGLAWVAQFILPKPSPEEIRAATGWKQRSDEFDKRVWNREHLVSYEADEHEVIRHKKSLRSYPRLKRAGKIRAWFLGTPIVLFIAYGVLFVSSGHTEDTDDTREADNQAEVAVETDSRQWFENAALRHWCWNVVLISSALGLPLWMISSLSEKRYLKILGADVTYAEADDEIYVADPTDFESWRQAFIERHGHDMSPEQEKKLRAKVDQVIDAYEQERAAVRKLSEKIDEMRP
jgi:hypothetical protein